MRHVIEQEQAEERSLIERVNRSRVESLLLWPDDLETLICDPRYLPWIAALPPPAHERIMRAAEMVRLGREADVTLLSRDLQPTPDFDALEQLGVSAGAAGGVTGLP